MLMFASPYTRQDRRRLVEPGLADDEEALASGLADGDSHGDEKEG